MNKLTFGRYTFVDLSLMFDKSVNRMRYHFLVSFTPQIRGEKPSESLYERIGGQPAVDAAVNLFYKKVLADSRICKFFDSTNMER